MLFIFVTELLNKLNRERGLPDSIYSIPTQLNKLNKLNRGRGLPDSIYSIIELNERIG